MSADTQHDDQQTVLLPAPTIWPVLAAFGLILLAATLVTNPWVGVAGGVILLVSARGWWHDVLPVDQHVAIPLRPSSQRAGPVEPRPSQVEHLQVGEAGHRVRVPARIHPYSAGLKGGAVGGVVMALFAVLHGIVVEGSFWYPVNLLAAVAMPSLGDASLEQLKQPNTLGLIVCIVVHGIVSLLVGLLYGILLPMLPGRHRLWGGLIIPLLWTGLIGATLQLVNPVLNTYVAWPWFIAAQLAFGLTVGFVVARSEEVETLQTWPLAARAGIEARIAPPPEPPVDPGESA